MGLFTCELNVKCCCLFSFVIAQYANANANASAGIQTFRSRTSQLNTVFQQLLYFFKIHCILWWLKRALPSVVKRLQNKWLNTGTVKDTCWSEISLMTNPSPH